MIPVVELPAADPYLTAEQTEVVTAFTSPENVYLFVVLPKTIGHVSPSANIALVPTAVPCVGHMPSF